MKTRASMRKESKACVSVHDSALFPLDCLLQEKVIQYQHLKNQFIHDAMKNTIERQESG
ncbi:hypothetical protein [Comamonas sp. A7-5]|uniref:hypothetical protein n=1 Tax=Comamonas sp. A7-5 TaxID=673549 RepID=UPI0031E35724